jgi:prepilin-type N-terminal cleavage/methylation domain-containing protein
MDQSRRIGEVGRMRPRLRAGFSLVELLVALLVVDVGLLALARITASLVRQRTELHARAAAIRAASSRLDWLGAGPCRATSGSAAPAAELTETWAVQLAGNATRVLSDSVSFGLGGTHAVVLHTRLPC